ncbi:uncharacterized protein C2orf73 homolog isoform X1 [Brienomyrus brachyistius]|uniref:uncharacterized protein C2orf73 homolog isoform X1 n=1 Tax=Brienomyrus brachyistius TaxID=42636 RepID=UPI0020B3D09D|nr:uncharacterized protein C2orf73 homolog isoform X1 [Brienomyrus brachyistius]
MHYGADMCLPRKKKVIQSFRSNTHRIFDEKVPDRLDANKIYNHHTYQRRTSEEINQLKTHNIPHPRNAKYIRSNVRFLNEPMAYIDVQQFNGWAKEAELNVKSTAPYSRNSTQRSDFQACPGTLAACTRYGMNPNKYPASGIVPTVSPTSTQKPLLEKICFIHQFDSRKPQDQAYEGKHHGTFVWSEFTALGRNNTFLDSSSQPGQHKTRRGNGMTSLQLESHPAQNMSLAAGSKTGMKAAGASAYPQNNLLAAGRDSPPHKGEGLHLHLSFGSEPQKFQDSNCMVQPSASRMT